MHSLIGGRNTLLNRAGCKQATSDPTDRHSPSIAHDRLLAGSCFEAASGHLLVRRAKRKIMERLTVLALLLAFENPSFADMSAAYGAAKHFTAKLGGSRQSHDGHELGD